VLSCAITSLCVCVYTAVTLRVTGSDGSSLHLEEVDFFWNTHKPLDQPSGDYRNGQKGAIVEMFGWPDADVEQECKVVGEAGYLGVKLCVA
jgi:alpha-amylase